MFLQFLSEVNLKSLSESEREREEGRAMARKEGGTGGKLCKFPVRKLPSTPYSRTEHQNRGWLPRLFPFFFNAQDSGMKKDAGQEDPEPASEILASVTKEGGQLDEANGTKCSSQIDEHVREKLGNSYDADGVKLDDIEKKIRGTTFSRDELNRLMEILNSRVDHSDDFASKRMSKSSIFHPAAVVQDESSYLTPQTQRGRIEFHNFPRTTYSRTVHPWSTSKRKVEILGDGLGSVGPIRRIRQKVFPTTPSRTVGSPHPASSQPLWTEDSDASKSFLPTFKRNQDPGASSSASLPFQYGDSKAPEFNVGVTTVHPMSSELARKILEHLDKTPTPEEKYAELKLAMAWKMPPSCEFTTGRPNEQFGRLHVEDSDSKKSNNLLGEDFSAQGNGDGGISFLVDSKTDHSSQIKMHEVSMGVGDSGQSQKNQPFPLRNQMDVVNVPTPVNGAAVSEGLTSEMKPSSQSSGAKLDSLFISTDKPDPEGAGFPDFDSAFTFPLGASSGSSSEPPTPTMGGGDTSVHLAAVSERLTSEMKLLSPSSGAKMGLTSMDKPDSERVYPDNGAAFTVPVSARNLPKQEGNTAPLERNSRIFRGKERSWTVIIRQRHKEGCLGPAQASPPKMISHFQTLPSEVKESTLKCRSDAWAKRAL